MLFYEENFFLLRAPQDMYKRVLEKSDSLHRSSVQEPVRKLVYRDFERQVKEGSENRAPLSMGSK